MSDNSDISDSRAPDEPLPEDAIRSAEAARIVCMTTTRLRRHAQRGRFRYWRHPDPERRDYLYSRADMEAERAKFRRMR